MLRAPCFAFRALLSALPVLATVLAGERLAGQSPCGLEGAIFPSNEVLNQKSHSVVEEFLPSNGHDDISSI